MSALSDDPFVRTTSALRRLFNLLASEWNELHRDLGISARMRALLEYLTEHGPRFSPGDGAGKIRFPATHSGHRE